MRKNKIINISDELNKIKSNYWFYLYNDSYINLDEKYTIRVKLINKDIWFEVDQAPCMNDCYLYSSQNLKDVLNWCQENLILKNNLLFF